jgi:peptide subunit release factor RF-3
VFLLLQHTVNLYDTPGDDAFNSDTMAFIDEQVRPIVAALRIEDSKMEGREVSG